MRDNKKRKDRSASVIDNILDVPKEVVTGLPKITILGFNEILIENYKGILEYEEFYIRVNTYIGVININGFNFNIKQMTEEDLLITGQIDSLDIENDELENYAKGDENVANKNNL